MVRKVKDIERSNPLWVVLWGSAVAVMMIATLAWIYPSSASEGQQIKVWHDRERQVTCWVYFDQAISCLPDRVVKWEEEEEKK